ncbi:MAG: hypothetical protein DME04_08575 [Candidatus Rokuibacteriota bacterium]|nr:MAG: hypothetical protein DME04_08575 [Candidatus Rokubacteria bacterium]
MTRRRTQLVGKLALCGVTALIVSLITVSAAAPESRLRTFLSKMTADGTSAAQQPRDWQDYEPVAELRSVHFDVAKAAARSADAEALDADAAWLKANPTYPILIEGYADMRGTEGYNLALGERRAAWVRDQLVARGVRVERIAVVSYGEVREACRLNTPACWAANRRADILVARVIEQRP